MKKSLKSRIDEPTYEKNEEIENEISIETDENTQETHSQKHGSGLDFSLSSIVSFVFIITLIGLGAVKIMFPAIDSIQANIEHRKMGKSVVYSYFNFLQNANYTEALKLIEGGESGFATASLTDELMRQLGSTEIVGYDILDISDSDNQSIVNTAISYVVDGQFKTKNQSLVVKNTPDGWKISLSGLIKKFKLNPVLVTLGNVLSFTPKEIEYCEEGINLTLKIKNNSYKKISMVGNMTLETVSGGFDEDVDTVVKPLVQYEHNLLFSNAGGDPKKLIVNLSGQGFGKCEIPVEVVN